MQPAAKKLSVSAILFGILAGIIGIGAGLILGFALGSALAAALHVSTFEGEAGYFAGAIAIIVTCIVTPGSILLTLYWRGMLGNPSKVSLMFSRNSIQTGMLCRGTGTRMHLKIWECAPVTSNFISALRNVSSC